MDALEKLTSAPPAEVETRIDLLKDAILQMPQADLQLQHAFGPGVYMRTITIPAGCVIIGHYHRHETLNVMISGKISVLVDGEVVTLEGPNIFVSKPGRKVAYAHEETIFSNVHATEETDLDRIEEIFIDKNYSADCVEHDAQRLLEVVGG